MVFPKRTKPGQIAGAVVAFTDRSSSGVAAFSIGGEVSRFMTDFSSVQLVELAAIVKVFELLPKTLSICIQTVPMWPPLFLF